MIRLVLVALLTAVLAGCAGTAAPTVAPTSAPTLARTAAPTPEPTPTPASTATQAASEDASELTSTDDLQPGRYFVDAGEYRYTFTVAEAGWMANTDFGAVFQGEDLELAAFWPALLPGELTTLYRDPCQSSGTEFDVGPSVDDLADALASLEGFDASGITDVEISGFEGKRIALAVPAEVDVRSSECDEAEYSLSADRWYQAAGQTDDMRILDLDGSRQVVTTSTTPGTPTDVAAQLEEMVDSLVIEPI